MKGGEGFGYLGDNASPLHKSDQAPRERFKHDTRGEKREKEQPDIITSLSLIYLACLSRTIIQWGILMHRVCFWRILSLITFIF